MPLQLAPLDTEVKVIRVAGNDNVSKHLASLGIVSGATVKVLSVAGGVVVHVLGSRVALGSDLARRIMVQPAY